MLRELGSKAIICSGVTLATAGRALDYIKTMTDILTGSSELPTRFPTCERNGVDQGIHNVIVHKNLVKGIVIHQQETSPVLNLQTRIATVNGTEVFNMLNELVPVAHQIDRYVSLQKLLFQKVQCELIDPRPADNMEAYCALNSLVFVMNYCSPLTSRGSE